jgi:hypothetical protein
MPNPLSRFAKFIVGSSLAQLLFLVHLVLVVYAVYRMPFANSDSWGSGGGCHGIPIADRVLFYCDATGLLGAIATLDFIAVALFGFFATLFGILFWWVPDIGFHAFSWAVAIVLLAVASFQWMLVGACVERLTRRVARNRGV